MTTLPQVSGSASSNGHADGNGQALATASRGSFSAMPAVASPIMSPMPAGGGAASGGLTGSDVMRVLRQNMIWIILAAVLSGAIGYGLNTWMAKNPTYTSEGYVLVQLPLADDPLKVINDENVKIAEDLKVRVASQRASLTSLELLNEVLSKTTGDLRESKWLASVAGRSNGTIDSERALEALQKAYKASPIEDSQYIRVSMDTGNPAESRLILKQIVQTRIDALRQQANDQANRGKKVMSELVAADDRAIENLERQIKEQTSAMSSGDGQSVIAMNNAITAIANELMETRRFRKQMSESLANFDESLSQGIDPSAVTLRVQQDPFLAPYRQQIMALETELAAARSLNGDNHPQVRQIQNRLDAFQASLTAAETTARSRAREEARAELASSLDTFERTEEELQGEFDRMNEEIGRVARDEKELQLMKERLERYFTERDSKKTIQAAESIAIGTQAPIPLEWADQPQNGDLTWPRLPITLGLCMFIGVGLAVGFAFLREVLDSSVRTPRDIARVGGINVLGVIPEAKSDHQLTGNVEMAMASAPHSMTADQFRGVRARLGHAAPLETTRTILVTSASPGEGKTTVAANLAAGLALNGRKILLVDANFRKPALHKAFGLENVTPGLSDCLVDAGAFDSTIHDTSVPNLSVMPAGQRPANPTELLEGANFVDVLDRALEEFDHVIFDSGPLLFASETAALAPQMDGVVSVVRAKASSRGMLGRLNDTLRSMNVEHLGTVLNAVRAQAGGYYNRNMKTFYEYNDGAMIRQ